MIKLFHGENSYESWSNLSKFVKKTKSQTKTIDGETLSNLDSILIGHDTFSMFSDNTTDLIIIRRFSKNRKKKLIEALIESLGQRDIEQLKLVFWEEGKIDKRGKLYKFIKKHGEESEHKLPSPNYLQKWTFNQLKNEGLDCSKSDVDKVIQKVGIDQYQLEQEISKLGLFVRSHNRTKLQEEDFDVLTSNAREVEIWAFLDAVSSRDKKQIIELFEELYTKKEDFPYLSAMLIRQLKILYLLISPKISERELTEVLGMHPYTLKNAKKYINKFNLPFIVLFMEKLTNLDYQVKQGKIDPKLGLTLLLSIM